MMGIVVARVTIAISPSGMMPATITIAIAGCAEIDMTGVMTATESVIMCPCITRNRKSEDGQQRDKHTDYFYRTIQLHCHYLHFSY